MVRHCRRHADRAQATGATGAARQPEQLRGSPVDNHDHEPWKAPLPVFIEHFYRRRFGRDRPEEVISIEEKVRRDDAQKEARRAAKAARRAAAD